jgi:hypothetical protein
MSSSPRPRPSRSESGREGRGRGDVSEARRTDRAGRATATGGQGGRTAGRPRSPGPSPRGPPPPLIGPGGVLAVYRLPARRPAMFPPGRHRSAHRLGTAGPCPTGPSAMPSATPRPPPPRDPPRSTAGATRGGNAAERPLPRSLDALSWGQIASESQSVATILIQPAASLHRAERTGAQILGPEPEAPRPGRDPGGTGAPGTTADASSSDRSRSRPRQRQPPHAPDPAKPARRQGRKDAGLAPACGVTPLAAPARRRSIPRRRDARGEPTRDDGARCGCPCPRAANSAPGSAPADEAVRRGAGGGDLGHQARRGRSRAAGAIRGGRGPLR